MGIIKKLALKPGEKTVRIGDILKFKEENPNAETEWDDLFAIGEGKGIPFEFKEGEMITFRPYEENDLIVRISKLNGKEYKLLSVIAESNIRGEVEVPLSIFRRIPALEEDRQRLVRDYSLTENLLQNNLSDLGRLSILGGHTVQICSVLQLAKVMFKSTNGVISRVDVAALDPKDRKTMNFYQAKFA